MKRLLLAVAVFALMACNGITDSDNNKTGDTLYIVTNYTGLFAQHIDSVYRNMYSVNQKRLDENNGFELLKLTEVTYGEGWTISVLVDSASSNFMDTVHFESAPLNYAYYFNYEEIEWEKIPLDQVYDSMEVKEVWK